MAIAVGSILEGRVTGITKFGAFVELTGGVTGLVHISEVADAYVKDVKDYLKEQEQVKVKVINVDDKGKIGLSIKQAKPDYETRNQRRSRPSVSRPSESFEDRLNKFMKESDEKLTDLRRHTDAKRGGRGGAGKY